MKISPYRKEEHEFRKKNNKDYDENDKRFPFLKEHIEKWNERKNELISELKECKNEEEIEKLNFLIKSATMRINFLENCYISIEEFPEDKLPSYLKKDLLIEKGLIKPD